MNPSIPIIKDLVLVGGGHSHVTVLKQLAMKPIPGCQITLISADIMAPYSGMLPGLIAGQYDYDEIHIDVSRLCRFAGVRFFHDRVTGLDLDKKLIHCQNRPPVPFDITSINTGSTPPLVPGSEHILPVKPVAKFLPALDRISDVLMQSDTPVDLGVVGTGAAGVEVILAIKTRLQKQIKTIDHIRFHLIGGAAEILPSHAPAVRQICAQVLQKNNISVHNSFRVNHVSEACLHTDNGDELKLDHIIWATGAAPAPWFATSGLATDELGFVVVNPNLQSTSHSFVFAAGDAASLTPIAVPKSGVYAVREGPLLGDNLRRQLLGDTLKPYRAQKRFLSLINTCDGKAIASRGQRALNGKLIWRWKDWIDRSFMRKFQQLPEMKRPASAISPALRQDTSDRPAMNALDDMRCGGCGSKVGGRTLSRALGRLAPSQIKAADNIMIGLNAPDDAAVIKPTANTLSVQTTDFFHSFTDDPLLLGQIAANHALGDLYAMGAKPTTALAIAVVPVGLPEKMEETLFQLLAGATETFNAAGVSLIGGHSSEGQLAIGFTVNGEIAASDESKILKKSGMQENDRLILTKPIGSGILLAADMRAKAKGQWIEQASQIMSQSSQAAAAVLKQHNATACTDVTGFGLLGHLAEMMQASAHNVSLDLNAVPLMEGAQILATQGIHSSLQQENSRPQHIIANLDKAKTHPVFPLLFDPQTAGGLLASIPFDQVEACLADLINNGYGQSAIIGQVYARSAKPTITTIFD